MSRIGYHHARRKPAPNTMAEIGRDVALFCIKDSTPPFGLQKKGTNKLLVGRTERILFSDYPRFFRKRNNLPLSGAKTFRINIIEGIKHLRSFTGPVLVQKSGCTDQS